jgi:hypothetical protein
VKTKVKSVSSESNATDITAVWERTKKRLDRMTKEKTLQIFVSAGILTKKGNPTKPYRGVFVQMKA